MIIETKFDIGDYVMVDGCASIKCAVIGIKVCDIKQNICYEIGWMNGGARSDWVDQWRVDAFDDSPRQIAPKQ